MDRAQRQQILTRGLSGPWQSEPMFGSSYGEEEIEAVVSTIRASMSPAVGFGFITQETEDFEQALAAYCDAKHAITVCTASCGLDMTMRSLDLQPGDEVICPSINFSAAPMSILGHGGTLVLCEVDPETLCADPNDVEKRMTPRTRALLITHMNGLSAPMDDFIELANRHPHPEFGPPKVIGDAARAVGGGYKGTKIGCGKHAWITVFSFHTMKNMSTLGEGGAIMTDDDDVASRLREMRQFGREHWGSSYKMTKVQAAVGPIQLRKLDAMIESRRRLAERRTEMLAGCPYLTLPSEPEDCCHSYYIYSVLVPEDWAGERRDRLIALLNDEYNVSCGIFNPPTHEANPFIAKNTQGQHLPLSSDIGRRLFCPPIHPAMSDEDNEYIAAALWDAVERVAAGEKAAPTPVS